MFFIQTDDVYLFWILYSWNVIIATEILSEKVMVENII